MQCPLWAMNRTGQKTKSDGPGGQTSLFPVCMQHLGRLIFADNGQRQLATCLWNLIPVTLRRLVLRSLSLTVNFMASIKTWGEFCPVRPDSVTKFVQLAGGLLSSSSSSSCRSLITRTVRRSRRMTSRAVLSTVLAEGPWSLVSRRGSVCVGGGGRGVRGLEGEVRGLERGKAMGVGWGRSPISAGQWVILRLF